MAKITKTEFLDNIQGIINEGFNPEVKVDNTKKFGIRRYVVSLLEAGQRNPKLMTYLNNYNNLLNSNTVKEFMLYEQFGHGLAQFATGNKDVKNVITQMNETLANNGSELQAYSLIECIQDPIAKDAVRDAYDNYLENEDEDSRNILIDAIDMCDEQGDPIAPKLTVVIVNDAASRLPQIELGMPESKFDQIQAKIKEEKERKRMEEIKDQVDAYARKVFDEAEAENQAEKEACTVENIVNCNGLDLRESIKNIASSDAKTNKKLMETIDQYAGALNQGLYEERLYESFLMNLSKFDYLLPVEKEIKRINEVAKQHAASIAVTKILEEMQTTPSYYIIPIIEEDAARYVKNPSDVNRVQLRNALCSFAADPFCHAMIEAIEKDGIVTANTLEEKAMSVKDKIKVIRENANVKSIYSPIQYIKENECVFNANGQFFVKKGQNLAKLSSEYIDQLSESFVSLCQLVNDPRVNIYDDHITLVGTDKIANIYEGYVDINGNRETTDTLRDLNEMCMKYDFDTNFFIMASCLHEHFNDIARVDFGKHISLNENEGINVDMFRLGNNIFINTMNETIDKSTFYHNVNPIQCRNIINKHMGINVASLFEDLIPSQEKIMLKLNEMKKEYEASIEKYENVLVKFKKAKDECVSEDNEKKLDDAIKTTEDKLDELKKEYKKWQENVEKETTEKGAKKDKEDEDDKIVEPSNTPLDPDEVEDAKAEMTEPLEDQAEEMEDVPAEEAPEDEEDSEISDEEFNSYLEGETEVPAEEQEPEEIIPEVNPEDLEEPAEEDETPAEENDEDKEAFQEVNIEEPVEDEEDFEVELPAEDDEAEDETVLPEEKEEPAAVPDGYNIASIVFDKNLKTGELFKTGTAVVICPMVATDGRLYVNAENYQFYIDEETNTPVVAADVPVALYNAIVATIQEDPEFATVVEHGISEITDKEADPIYYKEEEIQKASDELEKDDDNAYFDIEDKPEELTIATKDEEDLPELNNLFADEEAPAEEMHTEEAPEEAPEDIIIPTYKSEDGKTDIELPAPEVDNTDIQEITPEEAEDVAEDPDQVDELPAKPVDRELEIEFPDYDEVNIVKEEPEQEKKEADEEADEEEDEDEFFPEEEEVKKESVKPHVAKKLHESAMARQAIKKIQSEFKDKDNNYFFLSEGTIKPSKKEVSHISEATANIDGANALNEEPNEPYENYEENVDTNTLEVMHAKAENALDAASGVGHNLTVTPIEQHDFINYFTIEDLTSEADENSYTIYQIHNSIYYRPSDEFFNIIKDLDDEVPGQTEDALKVAYDTEDKLSYLDSVETDECNELVAVILQSFGIQENEMAPLDESIKVRRPKLSSEGDFDKSKLAEDAVHGDEEDRSFAEKIEKETQKAGVDNPLAPTQAQEEAVQQVLPNVHNQLSESTILNEKKDDVEIIYEPQDWVIIKETGMKAQVTNVVNNGDGDLTMLTVLASNGTQYSVNPEDIEPDPLYLYNMPGRVVNSQNLEVPEKGKFDLDPSTRLNKTPENEKIPELKDLNGRVLPVDIVVEGFKLNSQPCSAFVEDIKASKKQIRVINEDGNIDEYDAETNLEFNDMPYAVVVNSEGKPVRSIKVDPLSYINASEDELVACIVDDKETKFPKKCIDILS